jgi:glycosyltransferase involved in cell wall biosynthesis
MKSLFITSGILWPDIGGPASYAKAVSSRLSKQGVKVTILAYSSVRTHPDDATCGARVVRIWVGVPWGLRHILFALRAWQLARDADGLLLLNATSAGVMASWAARVRRKPTIVRVVGDYAWEIAVQTGKTFLLINDFQKAPKEGRIGRLDGAQKAVCRQASRVIVPSKYLADLVAQWGIDRDKIEVIYNGVDLPVLDIPKEEARKQLGISGNIILSAGRLVPWKGFRMLIKLMPQLLQINQFARLVIVGDGPDMKMLQTVVRNLGLERKVFLLGRKSAKDVALALAAADMFVLNTGYEGFSHQVLEAMQAGVPVITTTVGGNREVIEQGNNGLLVRYNDEFNIVEAIKTLWRNEELRNQLVDNARETVTEFSIERMYTKTIDLLDRVFEEK